MNCFMKTCVVIAVVGTVPLQSTDGQERDQSRSRIGGFVSGGIGSFELDFPGVGPAGESLGEDVGFDDVYGSNQGVSYWAEGGLGISDIGLFAIIRTKVWKKTGSPIFIGNATFNGTAEWSQQFLSLGARYFFVSDAKRRKTFLPFVGGGLIYSLATESLQGTATAQGSTIAVDASIEVDGTGYFLEGGADLYLTPNTSLRAVLEYSKLNLGISSGGTRFEIDGGGGSFAGLSLNVFFGNPIQQGD